MAALLRSARLLKFSPLGLLHIPGTRRSGPLLGRFYSGAVGGRRTDICSRQISHGSESVSRFAWPHAAGCVRSYVVASEEKDSIAVRSVQAQQFDWALSRLDNSVKRTGRITKTLLFRIFHDICRTGYPSGNQALLLLRSCGSLLPEVPLKERNELAHRVWDRLQQLGAQYDVSHYNALLKVYLQNKFKFSPTEFLSKMEAANIQPNRVTYQRLITAYCQTGDVEGASTILGFMKSKDLPITEAVFSSLVMGHAQAGDIDSAANILTVMRGVGIEPSSDTYVSLLNAYAEKGDLDSMKKTLEAAESADAALMDKDIMQVIYTLAKAGHEQHVPEMLERLRHERGFIADAINLCLNLITEGHEDVAFSVLKTFPTVNSNSDPSTGNFFLKHCINMDTPLEKIVHYCKELQEMKMHSTPFTFALSFALEANKIGISVALMELLKEQNFPIRPHYFWPLLTHPLKENNIAGVMEVAKSMEKVGVTPDIDTLTGYIFPVFSTIEAALQAFKNAGLSLDSEGFLSAKVRALAMTDLGKLYTQMSDPSFPSLDLMTFRAKLNIGFKKFSDVDSMVKIFELLYKDDRFCSKNKKPADVASYFLYNLIDSMTAEQVHAQENKLRNFFNQLQAQNITIPVNIYKGIRNILETYHNTALIKDVIALVDPNDRKFHDDFMTLDSHGKGIEELEKKMAELKAENKPYNSLLKQALIALSAEENLQRALELKQQHENEMTVGSYVVLITMCCRQNNVEEALNLKRDLNRIDSSVALDPDKYIQLVKAFAMNDKVEEAVDILTEMKEKGVVVKDSYFHLFFHMLNGISFKGDGATIRRLLDAIFTLGLAKPSSNLCSPLITSYLNRNDLSGALEAVIECQKRYNKLARINDVVVALVESGDTELLQKAMDFISQERGEMFMLYDLFFAFLQTGRYREARKIIETPGLRAKPGRLQWFAEKCISANKMEQLEEMVQMTAKLFECDRDEMYSYIIRLCKETNDWQKAETTWTKMQEENLIPRERTLRMLADILKNNNQEVPFEVPESWYNDNTSATQQVEPTKNTLKAESREDFQAHLLTLCKKGKIEETIKELKKANQKGVRLSIVLYDNLIRTLLATGSINEAMAVKEIAESHIPRFKMSNIANSLLIITHAKNGQTTEAMETMRYMVQFNSVPLTVAIVSLVQALSDSGRVAMIQELESLTKSFGTTINLPQTMLPGNMALAHIANGDLDLAVGLLEEICLTPSTSKPRLSFVFKKVVESGNEKAFDKLSAMAERLANHFNCYIPALDLFFQLLENNRMDEARFMLDRCKGLAEQSNFFMSFMSWKAQKPGQVNTIRNLMTLVPDFAEERVLYSYLMKAIAQDEDLASAKALQKEMTENGIPLDELTLKRLAVLYRNAGEDVPFTEPPESFKFYADKLRERSAKIQASAEE
ncbi:leucine-rich PPR motif-containing protein, mitochondrial [Kryptolebias marmoratus]|uniref:leucine-rich PPR motif-containing protein, mitochondrial n=1 Tax=Kryptolebias marmoratus TaxID=37003 RepID=UPI0007F900A6|nr:leucine-rich PPR motif-containing protein, mitochondrial [Kryptolebias marmoratus]